MSLKYHLETAWLWKWFSAELRNKKLKDFYFIRFYKFYKIKFCKLLATIEMELTAENLHLNNLGEERGKKIIPQTIKTFCEHGGASNYLKQGEYRSSATDSLLTFISFRRHSYTSMMDSNLQ